MRSTGLQGRKQPGEHHFVGVYLVPLLYSLTKKVPDYVNPDGTKRLIGDVIYFENSDHRLGIEVKLGTVRLTRAEFNGWIVGENRAVWPNIFLGVSVEGVLLLPWDAFRDRYISAVGRHRDRWTPVEIDKGYGPMKSVGVLCRDQAAGGFFKYADNEAESSKLESVFVEELHKLVEY